MKSKTNCGYFSPDFSERPDLKHLHVDLNHKRKQQYLDILFPGMPRGTSRLIARVLLSQKSIKTADLCDYASLCKSIGHVYLPTVLNRLSLAGCKIKVESAGINSSIEDFKKDKYYYPRSLRPSVEDRNTVITVESIGSLKQARDYHASQKAKRQQARKDKRQLQNMINTSSDEEREYWNAVARRELQDRLYVYPKLIAEEMSFSLKAKKTLDFLKSSWLFGDCGIWKKEIFILLNSRNINI